MAKYADRIADDLVRFLEKNDCIAVKEFPLSGFRSDVFCITKEMVFIDYEVKTSVKDFWEDFKKVNKQGFFKHDLFHYSRYANRIIFVMPPNLIPLHEIPTMYGVLHYCGDSFNLVRKGKEYYPYEPDEYYSDILEGATAKYTPELLVAFQKKFIKFLRFKIGAAYGEIENYKVFYDMQEKKIDSLNNELNDIYDNYGYTFR